MSDQAGAQEPKIAEPEGKGDSERCLLPPGGESPTERELFDCYVLKVAP